MDNIMTKQDLDVYHSNIITEINTAEQAAINDARTQLENIAFATDADIDTLFEDW